MVEVVEAHGFRLVLRPEIGGSIARFDLADTRAILYPVADLATPAAEGGGCFPLVPFSNRLRDGIFSFEGRDLAVSPNIPDSRRVVHGLGWRAVWTVVSRDVAGLTIAYDHGGGGGWPWPFTAIQCFRLDAAGLRIEMAITNQSTDAMPAGLGFHPYFPSKDSTTLSVSATGCEGVGNDGFPMAISDEIAVLDRLASGVSRPRNCYLSGVRGDVELRELSSRTLLSASPNLDKLVIFNPPDSASLCVEPVSHRVGALNETGTPEKSAAGITILEPGRTLTSWMRIAHAAADANAG